MSFPFLSCLSRGLPPLNVSKGGGESKEIFYFQECCHNAKNMYNTTNFYIRQVYTGLTQGKELQPLQKEVLDYIHKNIGKMNDTQYIHFVFFFHSSEWWCKWENNVLLPVPTKNLLRMLP